MLNPTHTSRTFLLGLLLASAAPTVGCSLLEDTAQSSDGVTRGRHVLTQPLYATSTDNRVVDPEFGLLATPAPFTWWVTVSPAKGGSPPPRIVRRASPRGVTASAELDSGSLALRFVGGHGPFEASVWVADQGGSPTPAVEAAVLHGAERSFPLVPREHVVIGDKTFVALRGEIDADLPGGALLSVTATSPVVIGAPEVLGRSERPRDARTSSAPSRARPLDDAETEVVCTAAAAKAERQRRGLL
jgi:hypothetical protein